MGLARNREGRHREFSRDRQLGRLKWEKVMNSRIAAAFVGAFVFCGAPAFAADNMSSGSMSGPAPKDSSMSSDNMSSGNMASDKGTMSHAAKPKHKKKNTDSAMKGGDSMHANTMGTGSGAASDNAMGTGH